jgi:nucleotide-binding universal stress UspA family protein
MAAGTVAPIVSMDSPGSTERSDPMFGRVLVATDLTVATRASLRAALDVVRRDDGEVLLFHVIRRIPGVTDREIRDFYDRLKANAKLKMHELTSWFTKERGVEIACEIVVGQPAREIVRTAQKRGVDLIVLSHAEGGRAPLGSVSYKVVQLAKCDVLVLKSPVAGQSPASRHGRTVKRRRG